MNDARQVKAALEAKRDDLQKRRTGLSAHSLEPLDRDLEDQATEIEDADPDAGEIEVLDAEIGSIDAALRRIDDGSYGLCEVCGERIAERRLEVQPEATLCIACASQRERTSASQ